VLILGGTGEARQLASALAGVDGMEVISSLAGRVRAPRLPDGAVRIGGFGGAVGLADWLRQERIDAVIDGTHPFAARITDSVVAATMSGGIPMRVLRRPAWTAQEGDDWRYVSTLAEAAGVFATEAETPTGTAAVPMGTAGVAAEVVTTPRLGDRVFLTIGRQELGLFAELDRWFLIRAVDPPEGPLPRRHRLILERPPYSVATELELLREHRIEVLVTKNSGGDQTVAKLIAARELGLPVVMVTRPPLPEEAYAVETVGQILEWLGSL
jgi:precorrin-6A/cobalt-precorrin-6A reductase